MYKTQKELFWAKWEAEGPSQRCQITNRRIYEPKPINFAHILPKGGYKRYKLEMFNLWLVADQVHRDQHEKGRSEFIEKYGAKGQEFYDLQDELRAQYHREMKVG